MSFKTFVSTSSAAVAASILLAGVDMVTDVIEVGDADDLSALTLDALPAIVVVTDADDEVDLELAPEQDELELDEDRDDRDVSWRLAIARCLMVPAFSFANGIWSIESMLEFDCK